MRALVRLEAAAGHVAVLEALRSTFAGGPAVFVASGSAGADAAALPSEVARHIGLVGQQVFAGEATRLAYGTDEAAEGRDSFLQKREPDWSPYPWQF